MIRILIVLAVLCLPARTLSCTCYPEDEMKGFCQMVFEAKSKPGFAIAQARILSFYHWGMYMEVVDRIYNSGVPDTILVWADCGACCRPGIAYEGFAIGDTLLMALQHTDLAGNILLPLIPDYEDSSDYMLSVCGTHFMRYRSGKVTGAFYPVTPASDGDTLDYLTFKQQIMNCVETPLSVDSAPEDQGVKVFPNPAAAEVHIQGPAGMAAFRLFNSLGQRVSYGLTDSREARIDLGSLPPGIYSLLVYDAGGRLLGRSILSRK